MQTVVHQEIVEMVPKLLSLIQISAIRLANGDPFVIEGLEQSLLDTLVGFLVLDPKPQLVLKIDDLRRAKAQEWFDALDHT